MTSIIVEELLARAESLTLDQLRDLSKGIRKIWLDKAHVEARTTIGRTDLRAGDAMIFTTPRDGLVYHAIVKSINRTTITAEQVSRPLGTPCSRWSNGVRVPANWCRKADAPERLTGDVKEQFVTLVTQLDSFADTDGEVPLSRLRAARTTIAKQWQTLERQVGRRVSEEEVWTWPRELPPLVVDDLFIIRSKP